MATVLVTGGVYGLYDGRIESTLTTAGAVTDQVTIWTNKNQIPPWYDIWCLHVYKQDEICDSSCEIIFMELGDSFIIYT